MTEGNRSVVLAALVTAAAAALALAASAQAATVTYMSTDVPKVIDDGQTAVSKLYGAENTPPVLDLEIVGVRITGSGAGASSQFDKDLGLQGPNSSSIALIGGTGGCDGFDLNITYDDSAATAFTPPGDCTATATRRPTLGFISRLYEADSEAGGGPSISGFWELTFRDFGSGTYTAPPATLHSWGLRASFAPMSCTAGGGKQELRKKIEFEVNCDSDSTVQTGGDAKRRTLNAHLGKDTLKVPLKRGARNRLEDGGKAKIKLEITNELGDFVAAKAKIRVTD